MNFSTSLYNMFNYVDFLFRNKKLDMNYLSESNSI